jgi:hypothetical protein
MNRPVESGRFFIFVEWQICTRLVFLIQDMED